MYRNFGLFIVSILDKKDHATDAKKEDKRTTPSVSGDLKSLEPSRRSAPAVDRKVMTVYLSYYVLSPEIHTQLFFLPTRLPQHPKNHARKKERPNLLTLLLVSLSSLITFFSL